MTHEQEDVLLDLKDRLLDSIHQIDELICGGVVVAADDDPDPEDDLDPDDVEDDPDEEEPEELGVTGIVDPDDAGRKQKPIEYQLRDRTVALKGNTT